MEAIALAYVYEYLHEEWIIVLKKLPETMNDEDRY